MLDSDQRVKDGLCELLPRLRRFARALAGNPQDADDLVQTAVERALARASQWRSDMRLDAWLYGIVRNAWIDEVRSRGRVRHLFAPDDAGANVGESSIDAQFIRMSVEAAMAKLPEEQRSAVALVLIEGLAYKEAASALDIPMGTLTSRLARGREALKRMLGDNAEVDT
ncbi:MULTISPECIES: sigma-70 family RNA polymerase sigma factor [unclassified Pseudoxanthomonas]|uniref:sigma-70 family RNA polymerase sigma factor n=1 Tax=unclassified Pseudoxanthomonas TaxID=2645906 RepID=UPI00307699CB